MNDPLKGWRFLFWFALGLLVGLILARAEDAAGKKEMEEQGA